MNGPDDLALQMAYTSILKAEHREKARIFEAKAEGIAEGKAVGIAAGKAEGIAVGKAEGIVEGEVKGQLKKAIEIATKMKTLAVPLNIIVKASGLTQEEIEKL